MSDLVFAPNCCVARMLPREAENGVGMNRSARGGKRFERPTGLDTEKNIPLLFLSYQ